MASTKPTWKMTERQLAHAWAAHYGFAGRTGGWIYDPEGRPVAQGWQAFGRMLAKRGFITVGQGIDWGRSGLTPRFVPGRRHQPLPFHPTAARNFRPTAARIAA